jgi:hypothetical protein
VKTAWIRHPQTEAVIEVPESAVPVYLQSDWVPLTDEETADLHKQQWHQRRAAEAAMGAVSSPTPPLRAQPEREQPKSAPARDKSGSSKENN